MSVPVYRKYLTPDEVSWNEHFDRKTPEEKARLERMGGGRFVLHPPKKKSPPKRAKGLLDQQLTEEQRLRVCGKRSSVKALFGKLLKRKRRR